MDARRQWLGVVLCIAALGWPGASVANDRARLDALSAQVAASEPEADLAAYRALAGEVLAEARRLFPDGHPEVAARERHVAMAHAAAGEMDAADAIVGRILPILEAAPAFRGPWRDALGLRAYILNFRGEHAEALAINERLAADYATDPGPSADHAVILSNLAASYFEHGRLDDALARNAEAIAMGLALDPAPPAVAIWSANRMVYLYSAGRTGDAIAAGQQALGTVGAALGADHPLLANLYANTGAILLRTERPNDAMPMIRRAFELTEAAAGGPTQNSAAMRVQFAQALVMAGRNDDALAFLDDATPTIDAQLGADSDRALVARDTRLVALIATGRGAEAQALAAALVAVRDARLPDGHRDRANARDHLASAAFANGDFTLAERAAAEAVALRERVLHASHPDLLLARVQLLRAQDHGDALPVAERVARARVLLRALAANASLSRGSTQAARQRKGFAWLAAILARHGASAEAFEAQQWSARTALDDGLALVAVERAAAGDPSFAARVADRRRLLAAREGLERRIEANLAQPDPGFDLAAVASELAANQAAISAFDAALSVDERARLAFLPATLDEFASAASGGRALAMFTDLDGDWLVTVAREGRAWQYTIDAAAGIDAQVARVRAALDAEGAFDRAAATALHATLFPPSADALFDGTRRLAVIADGALAGLPFGVLAPGGEALLLDRVAVERLVRAPRPGVAPPDGPPATPVLVALGGVAGRAAGERMALRAAGAGGAISALPGLPEAARELHALADAIGGGARLLLGPDATEAALRGTDVPDGAVMAFAVHGLLSGELDGLDEPALVLTPSADDDGLLMPSEIGVLDLPARLVVLSACNTAAGTGGPRLAGLVEGFFLAGAHQVMASHWPVRDDLARRLSVGTLRAMADGAEPSVALQSAIHAVRTGADGEPAATHPALWAPFEVFAR